MNRGWSNRMLYCIDSFSYNTNLAFGNIVVCCFEDFASMCPYRLFGQVCTSMLAPIVTFLPRERE